MLIISLSVLLVFSLVNQLEAEELIGEDVLEQVDNLSSAETSRMEFDITLYSSGGQTRERSLLVKSREKDDVEESFIRFLAPSSVEGTGFLSQDYGDEDIMYLYLPAVGSVRRIASDQQDDSFVGTDFTYNDLSLLGGGSYQDDYEAEIEEEIEEEREDEYMLYLEPVNEDIHYDFVRMRVQKDNWFPVEIELYEESELSKVMTSEQWEKIDNYWAARQITMEDVREETKTVLHMKEITYGESIDDQIFTTRYLERY